MLWNLAQREVLTLVPGKVLLRKFIEDLDTKINQQTNQNLCEITRGPPPQILNQNWDWKTEWDLGCP